MRKKFFWVLICIIMTFSFNVRAQGVTLPILLYHNITDYEQGIDFDVHIPTENFKSHMNYLKDNNYNTITFEEYYNYRVYGNPLPENPIIITFDDGYSSNYKIAYPYLKQLGFKATVFTVTNSSYNPKNFVYNHFNWMQAKEMQKSGVISIESHSANHKVHTFLAASELLLESRKSFYDIYKNTGRKPFAYAYPTGAFTSDSQQIVANAGYKIQCSVQGKLNNDLTPLNELKRLNIRGDVTVSQLEDLIKNSPY